MNFPGNKATSSPEEDLPSIHHDNNNKRILALGSIVSALILRPKLASAAAVATTTPLIDPAILTSTEELGMHALQNSNLNVFKTLLITAMTTVQMKQQSMTIFALTVGMMIALLKCAERVYVQFVEFAAEKCLGYYGISSHLEYSSSRRRLDWNEYVRNHLPKKRIIKKKKIEFVLDKNTMLFQPTAAVARVRGMYASSCVQLVTTTSLLSLAHTYCHAFALSFLLSSTHQPTCYTNVACTACQDDTKMAKAIRSYRERQYEQHHHLVHVDKAHSAVTSSSKYLDTLSKFSTSPLNQHDHDHVAYLDGLSQQHSLTQSSWGGYENLLNSVIQNQAEYKRVTDKLQIMKNLLTWDDYKRLVTELQLKKEECSKLEEEVMNLKKLVQVEQDASQVSGNSNDELKSLEDKAKAYDETMMESKGSRESVRWH